VEFLWDKTVNGVWKIWLKIINQKDREKRKQERKKEARKKKDDSKEKGGAPL
jgi:hypothetical protein